MNRTLSTLLVTLCGFAAYGNSFQGAFVFDDLIEIAANPAVHRLWPPWVPMFGGNDVAARPLPYLSFAIDYALYGDSPFGYHATNLAIHLLCAVLLLWLVNQTLRTPAFSAWWQERSLEIATAVAVIWVVHPLTTQAVTYIYQRMESVAALLIVAAVACAAAAFSTGLRAETATRRRSWQLLKYCRGADKGGASRVRKHAVGTDGDEKEHRDPGHEHDRKQPWAVADSLQQRLPVGCQAGIGGNGRCVHVVMRITG